MRNVVVVLLAAAIVGTGTANAQGPFTERDEIAIGAHYVRESYQSSSVNGVEAGGVGVA